MTDFLLEQKVIIGGSNIFREGWINKLSEQINTATNRASRLFHKSMGNLIALQEQIVVSVAD